MNNSGLMLFMPSIQSNSDVYITWHELAWFKRRNTDEWICEMGFHENKGMKIKECVGLVTLDQSSEI